MRVLYVYYGDMLAGQLIELTKGSYEFIYDDDFFADSSTPPVSVNMPKSQKAYYSDYLFPVFANLLPEGANRSVLCRINKVDEDDLFGMLEMISGKDTIGLFTLKKSML